MLTRVGAQVAREGVSPAAGIAAQVALEWFLPRVELDVPQQVALLGEGGTALAALERTLSWEEAQDTEGNGAVTGCSRKHKQRNVRPYLHAHLVGRSGGGEIDGIKNNWFNVSFFMFSSSCYFLYLPLFRPSKIMCNVRGL